MAKGIPNSLPWSSFLSLIETLVIFFFSFFLSSLLYSNDRQKGGENYLYQCVESCRSPQILSKARCGWVGQGGRVVSMVLLWILLLLCTVCTQGRKQALGRWYPVVQSAWMVRRESVHVLVTVGVTLGTTANKLPQSSSGMMFFSIRIINLWMAPQRVCRCQGSAIPVGSMSSDTLMET